MVIDPTTLAVPFYVLLIGVELGVHAYTKKKSYRTNDAVTNINLGVTSKVSDAFLQLFAIGIYTLIYDNIRFITIPNNAFTWILAFILCDFLYYWAHRKSHEISLFWGGHSVHHQSEEYNLSVALRQSTFQVIWTSCFYYPMALMGIHPLVFVSVIGFNLLYQFWIHTESIKKLPNWFEAIFNTPSHHRVHHGRNPKYIDRNHAGVLIIWDKLFGTFKAEEETPTYGITKTLKSWNPVWANFAHYGDMLADMRSIPKWKDKLLYIIKPPGWLPDYMGGLRMPPEVEPGYQKFDATASKQLNIYIFTQYVIIIGLTAIFLFNIPYFDDNFVLKAITSAAIIFSTVCMGALFESKSWAVLSETFRLLATATIVYYLAIGLAFSPVAFAISAAFVVASGLWLYRVKP